MKNEERKMKKTILWAAIAAFTATGCSETDSLDKTNAKQLIDFSVPGIGKQTRAPISGTTYPEDVPFGVYSYMLINSDEWTTNKADAEAVMNGVEISYQTSVWKATAGGPYYWPSDEGSSLTFICYSPKSTSGVSYNNANSDGLTITNYVNNGSTDLLYSNEIKNQKYTTASGVVAPEFNHALTQIYFAAQTASEYNNATVTIKSIKLNNIISKGTFKANPESSAAWTLDEATKATFTPYENSEGQVITDTEANVGDALVMLPQADLSSVAQTVTIVYDLTGSGVANETVTKNLTLTGSWERNAKIKYLLTISLKEILFSPTINDWATESNGTFN